MKKSDIIDFFWDEGYFEAYRTVKEISDKIWKDYKVDAGNITMTLKLKKYLRNSSGKGWKQIKPPSKKFVTKSDDIVELQNILGVKFEKEIYELKIALQNQPDCTAFLMRKILEKLLFLTLIKSNQKDKIDEYKKKNFGKLPQLGNLINLAKMAQINNIYVTTSNNLDRVENSKFLGDNSAHNYLINISFEDIKPEITPWRI